MLIAQKSKGRKAAGMTPSSISVLGVAVCLTELEDLLLSCLPPLSFSLHFLFFTKCSLHLPGAARSKIDVTSPLRLALFHSSPSMFHRFCLDRAGDSVPLWGILGNKSYSCLHVEAHGKVLAHFFTQTNISTKWRKVGRKSSIEVHLNMCLLWASQFFNTNYSSVFTAMMII